MILRIIMSIRTKIITIIALTLVLSVTATTVILIRLQSDEIINSKFQDTLFISDLIVKSIDNAMKEGRTVDVQKILENIGRNRELMHLRILSPDGRILKSKNGAEIGTKSRNYIQNLLYKKQGPTLIDKTAINYFKEIPNREECYKCHANNEMPIGIIEIKHDISRSHATILSIKKLLVISSITIVLSISLILGLLFSRFVLKPLKNLLLTIYEIEGGNLQATVKVSGNDELGIIGTSFNNMINTINSLHDKNINKEREIVRIKAALDNMGKVEDLNSQLGLKIKELEKANKAVTFLSKELKSKNIELIKTIVRLKKISDVGNILPSTLNNEDLMKIISKTTAEVVNAEKVTLYMRNELKSSLTVQYEKDTGTKTMDRFPLEYKTFYDKMLNPELLITPVSEIYKIEDNNQNIIQIGMPLEIKGHNITGAILLENKADGSSFTEDEIEILKILSNQASAAIENILLYDCLKNNYFATIKSFVNAIEANDRFAKGHSERVRVLSIELGRYIGLDFTEIEVLEHASILHDIGKIGIDSFILQKHGKLTSNEYSLIKEHPVIGEKILCPIGTLNDVRNIILQHHERYDGKGYPYKLDGKQLSLKARILTVVDSFDAMMTDRPYRDALPLYKVREELRSNAGTQFDPDIVKAFIEMIDLKGEQFLSAVGYNITLKITT